MSKENGNGWKKPYSVAKLTIFDGGWGDKVLYKERTKSIEKDKGVHMIQKIMDLFGISFNYLKNKSEESIRAEIQKIKWTRDEDGRIISPFRSEKITKD